MDAVQETRILLEPLAVEAAVEQALTHPDPAVGDMVVQLDTAKAVRAFVRLRDKRSELKKAWETEDADLKEKQTKIGNALLNLLNTTKQNSGNTEHGTFYKQEKIVPTGADWEAFYRWIIDKDLVGEALERRIKANFIKEYMETHDGAIPPGVSVYREFEVRVRRSN